LNDLLPEQKHPTDIGVDLKHGELCITWADGLKSVYSLEYLRKICPCAVCNEQRSDDNPLRVFSPDQAMASGKLSPDHPVEMVGNYALQFFWDDGHQTGLYTFEYLRRSAPPS
jgi:DUF971 family protein